MLCTRNTHMKVEEHDENYAHSSGLFMPEKHFRIVGQRILFTCQLLEWKIIA